MTTKLEELETKLVDIGLQQNSCYERMRTLDYKNCDDVRDRLSSLREEERSCKFAIRIEKASELEKQFLETYQTASAEINDLLNQANVALRAAEKLADEKGIPFNSGIVFNGDSYIPRSLGKKWSDVSSELMEEIFEEDEISQGYGGYLDGGGWVTSYC